MFWYRDSDHKGTVCPRITISGYQRRYRRKSISFAMLTWQQCGYLPVHMYSYYQRKAKRKRGIINECKQTPGFAARALGTATIFRGKAALGGFTASVAPRESTKSNSNGKAPGPAVPVEKGGKT